MNSGANRIPILCTPWSRLARVGLGLAAIWLLGMIGSGTPKWSQQVVFAAAASGQPSEQLAAKVSDATTIILDLNTKRGEIDANAFGLILGTKGYEIQELNHFFRTSEGQQQLAALGTRLLFYWADRNDWANPYDPYTAVPASPPWVMYTDEFLNLSEALGAEPMIAVNITHRCWQQDPNQLPSPENVECEHATPQMAVNWIKYIHDLGRSVKYVQLGAEPYSGCLYWVNPAGVNCTDKDGEHKIALHQDEYAKRVRQWTKALKKVDKNIKVGLHLQPNTTNLCYQSDDCGRVSWDEKLLKTVGNVVDFVITHQYFILPDAPSDEATAQKYSYYQEQIDIRVNKQGVTAMPKQIRKELVKWLPARKDIPLVVGEFNAARLSRDEDSAQVAVRTSLYAGFSVAELYLDMLQPVKVGGKVLPGAKQLILLNLHSLPVFIAHFLPLDNPSTLVYTPAWHILSMLKEFQGKTIIQTKVKNNPQTPVQRPALRAYAVVHQKNVWLAVFNHDAVNSIVADIRFLGGSPRRATFTQIGHTAASFLTQNTPENPNAIVPEAGVVSGANTDRERINNYVFPPHSVTVFKIKVK